MLNLLKPRTPLNRIRQFSTSASSLASDSNARTSTSAPSPLHNPPKSSSPESGASSSKSQTSASTPKEDSNSRANGSTAESDQKPSKQGNMTTYGTGEGVEGQFTEGSGKIEREGKKE